MDSFFLFLSDVIKFKTVRNTMKNICRCNNRHLEGKVPQPPAGTLGFKSFVL